MSKIIKNCPKCRERMYISEFKCYACDTQIRGEFEIEEGSVLDRLSEEDKYFVLVFLQTGGKIQDVERVMGISYPTVKSKLQEIQEKLKGSEPDDWDEAYDYFDKKAFKEEMQQFKRNLKKHLRDQMRHGIRKGFKVKFDVQHGHQHDEDYDADIHDMDEDDIRDIRIDIDHATDPDAEFHHMPKPPFPPRPPRPPKPSKPAKAYSPEKVQEILDKLEKGEIKPDEAIDSMKNI